MSKVLVGFRASEELLEKLENQRMEMGGITRSSLINIILSDFFKNKEKSLKKTGEEK